MNLKVYGLKQGHYFTSPGISWDSMLALTKILIDLKSNPNIYNIFEKQSSGGISTIGNVRYPKANNEYCEEYDKQQEHVQIIYLDTNNLYGYAMSKNQPNKDIQFSIKANQNNFVLISQQNNKHQILVMFMKQIYNTQKDFFQNIILILLLQNIQELNMINYQHTTKMQQNDYKNRMQKNLKQILQEGLIISKMHRTISFKQNAFRKQDFDLNTQLRQKAKNDFEKDFQKLMKNSVLRKLCENVRNRVNYELVQSKKKTVKVDTSKTSIELVNILHQFKNVRKQLNQTNLITSECDAIMADTDSLLMKITCDKITMYMIEWLRTLIYMILAM
ncbi:hypothetical protein TTHERM_00365410 (macronuclear) [Tetrahymena thermophila SB210]|uniref:DNA-directed DNA polymerase n=1 Tax=Tetrahymena thermophila (strain SB210) TaxID=312017 RepID=Q22PA0_TETTS|nr:hypothetical protein TTHERM_00365410 [Tetrahymena thermophila SB210]EAR87209.2 hypothetical protein TTHERM_00365410 [Tetrahymena thermophila SB210]|eukprot:XP_001007454.2 hypothetical protein TTHERM_00365410 [Tetrahymena thermophila SB210]